MKILAIETSCDETACAILKDGEKILTNLVASQEELHRRYGGIVPELASRKHMEVILPLTQEALERANLGLEEIDAVCVTNGPGLIGSLVIGVSFAKALAYGRKIPLIACDHINAHILAVFLEKEKPPFPFVALVVSGGHTALFWVKDYLEFYLLGQTRDDAAGEAFDKVAKLLGLGYPGGRIISRLAEEGNPDLIPLPRPMLDKPGFDFSFSGLKTAVVNYVNDLKLKGLSVPIHDLCAAFEKAVVEVLKEKAVAALLATNCQHLVLAGGVAANKRLRETLKHEAQKRNFKLYLPSPEFCTDNAAMIAVCGYHKYLRGEFASLDLDVYARANFKKLSL
ncbi:metalloendopeptidase, glycoprotease family [Thermodesulfatator indicus DSM 15286]|uniref:tRNA N6-adenosine threonylcarbamoyltransferase n=1 Tax=Thermodesulfatator indicus (strain DSM 15286 / JCM 11887 / CIR29812) TaxID=667014 RepID=F8ADU2_THEID|nr:tRNA (adenosine(37)-N6)-threonylcarbamoyltransferase complex transferase subunit TsaD [Thermodesulfatator indicus]AEH46053.1 metalloendopeptidase, glycoprotease family [Thermodesulfatator indicus DSM 15286]